MRFGIDGSVYDVSVPAWPRSMVHHLEKVTSATFVSGAAKIIELYFMTKHNSCMQII